MSKSSNRPPPRVFRRTRQIPRLFRCDALPRREPEKNGRFPMPMTQTRRRFRYISATGPCPFNDPLGLKAAGGGKMPPRAQSPNLRSSCAEIKPAKRRSLNPSHPMGNHQVRRGASGDPVRTSTPAGRLSRSCAARVHGYEDVVREVTAHGPPPTRTRLRAKTSAGPCREKVRPAGPARPTATLGVAA